jgi:hypothetical protein
MKFLFLVLISISAFAGTPPVFPKECQENCVTRFGEKLGTADGVDSYSNCQPKCVFENPSLVENTFAGIQWQCVEFARRWLMINKQLTFESIDVAADLWNKVGHLVNFKTKETVPVENHINGSALLPKHGDLLIYGREYLGTGHVAIVLKTDPRKHVVYVGEQNYKNSKWTEKFARRISYVKRGSEIWLLDPYLIGWKTY